MIKKQISILMVVMSGLSSYVHSLAYGWANNRTHYFPKNSLGVSPVMRLKRRVKW